MEQKFDLKQITADVKKVLRYSQDMFGEELPGVDNIMSDWLENKQFFIEHMGGKLIYQLDKPVSFELDTKAKKEKLDRFAEEVASHYENWNLSDFLFHIDLDDFYNNRTSHEYKTEIDVTIPSNFKVVKAFKFFVHNDDILKRLQSEASRIIQENVISGYLCFSVHPLDYLSLSENVHNWRSCHALDGEYRSGNLNYMVDDTTVICYLRAEKQAVLPHFPEEVLWNSKKWRVLLFFANDKTMVFAGRQYPFTANVGIDLIRTDVLPALCLGSWTKWVKTSIRTMKDEKTGIEFLFTKMIPVGNELVPFIEVVRDGADTYQFDDLLRSTIYSPMWSYRKKTNYWDTEGTGCSDAKLTKVIVGKACSCPSCGRNIISYTNLMCCPTCATTHGFDDSDYYECEICGSMTFCDDMYDLEYSGMRVCPDCYRRETARCQECGIHDMPNLVKYHDGDTRCLCPSCWENAQQQAQRPVNIEDIRIDF